MRVLLKIAHQKRLSIFMILPNWPWKIKAIPLYGFEGFILMVGVVGTDDDMKWL